MDVKEQRGVVKNLLGKKFGKLKVIEYAGIKDHYAYWICKCDCGKTVEVKGRYLINGDTKSCGCLKYERKALKHGKCNTRLYRTWRHMKERCQNPNTEKYYCYGGRGIKVCDEWNKDFINFYNWAINNGYEENLSIDRVDVDGDYCPENCRWITQKKQCNNTRNCIYIEVNSIVHTAAEWSEIKGICANTIRYRYAKGITGEKLFWKAGNVYEQ